MGLLSTIGAASGRAFGFTRSAIAAATDAFFNRVTLLLHGDGTNGAQNNTFLDSSSNNFTITRNGNATQGTFTPFSQTGWSNYFNGSTDYLSVAANAAFDFSSSNFTIEAWVYIAGNSGLDGSSRRYANIFSVASTSAFAFDFVIKGDASTTGTGLEIYNGTSIVGVTGTITQNAWHHVAVSKSGSSVYFWLDGAQLGTTQTGITGNWGSSTVEAQVGGENVTSYTFRLNGYLSNVRVTKGGALYTSAFTPSTTPLTTTVSAGTVSLLTCQDNRFKDNSANAFAVTVNGSPSIQAFSPFAPTAAYSAATVGGSGYFDGSGDYLTLPNINFGSNDFCAECWFYRAGNDPTSWSGLFAKGTGDTTEDFRLQIKNDTVYFDWGSTGAYSLISATVISQQWNHIAVARSSGTIKIFLNGTQIGSNISLATISNNYTTWTIGSNFAGNTFTGYIAGLRFVNGSPVYTSNFTPPTAPPTAITNTQLLLNFTNGGIFDQTGKNVLETVGNAQISTSVKKYGTGSLAFDGNGDWLSIPYGPNLALKNTYTIEAWIYPLDTNAGYRTMFMIEAAAGAAFGAFSLYQNGTTLGFEVRPTTGGSITLISGTALVANTWQHVAISVSGTSGKLFLNGSQIGTTTTLPDFSFTVSSATVGGHPNASTEGFYGYIDDLRITKYARYTANFTPPTAAFADQ